MAIAGLKALKQNKFVNLYIAPTPKGTRVGALALVTQLSYGSVASMILFLQDKFLKAVHALKPKVCIPDSLLFTSVNVCKVLTQLQAP